MASPGLGLLILSPLIASPAGLLPAGFPEQATRLVVKTKPAVKQNVLQFISFPCFEWLIVEKLIGSDLAAIDLTN